MPRIWDAVVSDEDRAVFAAAGYGQRAGPGRRPALLVVDVTHDFVGDRPEPILDSIRRFPNSCGEAGWRGMEQIRVLLEVCRSRNVPVLYSKGLDEASAATRGSWAWKNARELEADPTRQEIGNEIPEMIAPLPGEVVVRKPKPSALFASPLAGYLVALGVDTLIIAGTTTSGCVRSTAVDAFSLNYRVVVAEDAVFDRGRLAHLASLFDLHAKYADVLTVDEIVEYLGGLPASG